MHSEADAAAMPTESEANRKISTLERRIASLHADELTARERSIAQSSATPPPPLPHPPSFDGRARAGFEQLALSHREWREKVAAAAARDEEAESAPRLNTLWLVREGAWNLERDELLADEKLLIDALDSLERSHAAQAREMEALERRSAGLVAERLAVQRQELKRRLADAKRAALREQFWKRKATGAVADDLGALSEAVAMEGALVRLHVEFEARADAHLAEAAALRARAAAAAPAEAVLRDELAAAEEEAAALRAELAEERAEANELRESLREAQEELEAIKGEEAAAAAKRRLTLDQQLALAAGRAAAESAVADASEQRHAEAGVGVALRRSSAAGVRGPPAHQPTRYS